MMKSLGLQVVTSCVDHVHHDLKEEKISSKLFCKPIALLYFQIMTPKTDTEKTLYFKMNNDETFRFTSSY